MSLFECMLALAISGALTLMVYRYSHHIHQILVQQSHRVAFENEWMHVSHVLQASFQQSGSLMCEKINTYSELIFWIKDQMNIKNFLQFEENHLHVRYVDAIQSELILIGEDQKHLYVRGSERWRDMRFFAVGDCRAIVIFQAEKIEYLHNNIQLITLKKALPFEFHSGMRVAPYHHVHFFLKKSKNKLKLMVDDGVQKNTLTEFVDEIKWIAGTNQFPSRIQFVFNWNHQKIIRWINV